MSSYASRRLRRREAAALTHSRSPSFLNSLYGNFAELIGLRLMPRYAPFDIYGFQKYYFRPDDYNYALSLLRSEPNDEFQSGDDAVRASTTAISLSYAARDTSG